MDENVEQILELLEQCSPDQRKAIFRELRKEITIHPIEEKLNIQAEIILEAINKDERGLTLRMIRGVIAEAAFDIEVISKLQEWNDNTPEGNLPYDFRLQDAQGAVTVQVKLQRSKDLKPMTANEAYRRFSENQFVVETQKTRGEKMPKVMTLVLTVLMNLTSLQCVCNRQQMNGQPFITRCQGGCCQRKMMSQKC